MAYKIEINREMCIGCGACTNTCDNFELGNDGKARVKKEKIDLIGCNKDAADGCPVQCIKISVAK